MCGVVSSFVDGTIKESVHIKDVDPSAKLKHKLLGGREASCGGTCKEKC